MEVSDGPPDPFSYFWPLIFVVIICSAYLYVQRQKRVDPSFEMRDILASIPWLKGKFRKVQLPTERPSSRTGLQPSNPFDRLPPRMNSRSTRSNYATNPSNENGHPALTPQANADTYINQTGKDSHREPSRLSRMTGGRRSARGKGPVEADDDEDDYDSEEGGEDIGTVTPGSGLVDGGIRQTEDRSKRSVFGIGDDEGNGSP